MTKGDLIRQYGSGNIGKAVHLGSGDIVAGDNGIYGNAESRSQAIDNLLQAIDILNEHLDAKDRKEVDAAARQIDLDRSRSELEDPLRRIAGIASLTEGVGVPVISAIKALLAIFS